LKPPTRLHRYAQPFNAPKRLELARHLSYLKHKQSLPWVHKPPLQPFASRFGSKGLEAFTSSGKAAAVLARRLSRVPKPNIFCVVTNSAGGGTNGLQGTRGRYRRLAVRRRDAPLCSRCIFNKQCSHCENTHVENRHRHGAPWQDAPRCCDCFLSTLSLRKRPSGIQA
jgi:hypothetical protein